MHSYAMIDNSPTAPYDVAQKASVIISMVPTGEHVQEVYVGKGKSVLSALMSMNQEERAATLCMDQSTVEQKVSKTVALQLREAGADLIDAPVSGGKSNFGCSRGIKDSPGCRCRWCRERHPGHHGRGIQVFLRSSSPNTRVYVSKGNILWRPRRRTCCKDRE